MITLHCKGCNKEVEPRIRLSGPHWKASCPQCRKYIKFLSKEEILYETEDRDESKKPPWEKQVKAKKKKKGLWSSLRDSVNPKDREPGKPRHLKEEEIVRLYGKTS